MTTSDLITCLWFDGNAEEAAKFYTSVFADGALGKIVRAPADYPAGKAGDVLLVEFTLMGQQFVGLNAGANFKFNEAISFQIPVSTQADADRIYDTLSAVPEAEMCGWLKDRFGVSWQIYPRVMRETLAGTDSARSQRIFIAMMEMRRMDIASLEEVARG